MAVRTWDPTPYPDPRKDRRGALKTTDPTETPEVIAPRVRLCSFSLTCAGASHRSRVGFGPFTGPLIVKDITFNHVLVGLNGAAVPGWAIYYQATPYTDVTSESALIVPTGTPLFEQKVRRTDGGGLAFSHQVTPLRDSTTLSPTHQALNFLIRDTLLFLSVQIEHRNAAGGSEMGGVMRVYENVDPRYAGRFMQD